MPLSLGINVGLGFFVFFWSLWISGISYGFEKDRAILAATLDYPPYEYLEDGQPKGIAVEIIREAVKRTGVNEVVFEFFPWKRAVFLVESGQNDILFNAGKNQARQQWGYYVDSTLRLQKYVLFKKRSKNIEVNPDFSNVKDKSIAVRLGYLYGSGPFRHALDEEKFNYVILSNSTRQSVDLLLGDRVDFFVGDYLPVMHYIKENALYDRIDIVKEPVGRSDNLVVLTWPTYILFSNQKVSLKYVQEVEAAMNEMKADGFIDSVFEKYAY